ncbi:DUF222 domain-containing protein [Plantactinospora siamensis]|uniref:DUF222 domain-containing protein n=1 Tax=Plantactinospora siamensis TaxID=555372 RepID=A0ABV6NRF4_9ACTN
MIDRLGEADAAVSACLAAPLWSLDADELVGSLVGVHGLLRRLAALELSLVREVDGRDLGRAQGAASTAGWLRDRLRVAAGPARRLVSDASWLATGAADPTSGATARSGAADCGADAAGGVLHEAVTAGDVSVEQAKIIAAAVGGVRAEAGIDLADKALHTLLADARELEPSALRSCADRILQHVAPELAEEADRRALAAAEQRAERRRDLTLSTSPEGWVRLRGVLDAEAGSTLIAALDPLTKPNGPGDDRSPGQRRHDAMAEIARLALRTGELPDSGGEPAQIVVTTSFAALSAQVRVGGPLKRRPSNAGPSRPGRRAGNGPAPANAASEGSRHAANALPGAAMMLRGATAPPTTTLNRAAAADGLDASIVDAGLAPGALPTTPVQSAGSRHHLDRSRGRFGVGLLDSGLRLSAATVRRLACDAGILPAVLGGQGQVLDVGRQRRLFTGPLRRALVLRDRGCAFPGCDRPPRRCAGHHIQHWTDGGETALHNAVLLCGYHHRVVHRGEWTVRLAADGHPEFRPPHWVDPERRPRRNRHHLRC